jgi:hypothetical protein
MLVKNLCKAIGEGLFGSIVTRLSPQAGEVTKWKVGLESDPLSPQHDIGRNNASLWG